jgi:hypothetical protein
MLVRPGFTGVLQQCRRAADNAEAALAAWASNMASKRKHGRS